MGAGDQRSIYEVSDGVGGPRVRLVATTDTLAYCFSGDVGQEC